MHSVDIKNLSFSYNSEQIILKDMNIEVAAGDFVCLLGQSGCGKSTFLRLLAGAGTALNLAFILLVIAETFATTSGLGFFIQFNADFFNYANVVAGLIFTSSVIIVIMLAFDRFKRRLLFWMLSEAQK